MRCGVGELWTAVLFLLVLTGVYLAAYHVVWGAWPW